jgi:hypothetical protein
MMCDAEISHTSEVEGGRAQHKNEGSAHPSG